MACWDRQPPATQWHKGHLPSPTLESMAHYFLDRLTVGELDKLKRIATGLNGKTVPIGSTCSGLATTGPSIRALFNAINQRFNTNIQAECEFAVENNAQKQSFILGAHQNQVKHLFEDVRCFENDEAYCLKEKQMVPIPKVFLLVASPSCVNLSGQRSDRCDYAASYEDGVGESAVTYELGYK